MAKTKYGEYVKSLTFKDYGPGLYRQGTKMNGAFLGYDVHMQYGTYWAAGKTGKEPAESEVHGVYVIPHNPLGPISTAACLHLDACIPNFEVQEYPMMPE